MSKLDFENMLNKKIKEEKEIDWEEQKNEWLGFIELFYQQINQCIGIYTS